MNSRGRLIGKALGVDYLDDEQQVHICVRPDHVTASPSFQIETGERWPS